MMASSAALPGPSGFSLLLMRMALTPAEAPAGVAPRRPALPAPGTPHGRARRSRGRNDCRIQVWFGVPSRQDLEETAARLAHAILLQRDVCWSGSDFTPRTRRRQRSAHRHFPDIHSRSRRVRLQFCLNSSVDTQFRAAWQQTLRRPAPIEGTDHGHDAKTNCRHIDCRSLDCRCRERGRLSGHAGVRSGQGHARHRWRRQ